MAARDQHRASRPMPAASVAASFAGDYVAAAGVREVRLTGLGASVVAAGTARRAQFSTGGGHRIITPRESWFAGKTCTS